MPVLRSRRDPDDVARTDLLHRTAPDLHEPQALRDDQGLAQRVGVPRGAGAGLEGDAGAPTRAGAFALKRRSTRTGR